MNRTATTISTQGASGGASSLRTRRATVFAVAAALPIVAAVNGGGYDVAFRQQGALLLWAVIAVLLAFEVLPRARPPTAAALPLGAMLGLTLITALSLGWTESDERTYEEMTRVAAYGAIVVLAFAGVNRYTWRAAAAGLTFAAAAISALAILSRLAPGLFPDDPTLLLAADRLSYPLGYWNALGCWAAMTIGIALTWSAHASRAWVRGLLLACLPIAGLVVYLTYSRGGSVGAIVAVIAALTLSRHRWTAGAHTLIAVATTAVVILVARGQPEIAGGSGTDGAGIVAAVLIAAAAVCALVAVACHAARLDRLQLSVRATQVGVGASVAVLVLVLVAASGQVSEAWDEFRHDATPATGADGGQRLGNLGGNRYEYWSSALAAFSQDSARGVGAGSFEFWWAREGTEPEFVRDAHSLYLESLAELGLIGFALLIAVLGGALALALRVRRQLTRPSELGASGALVAAFLVFLVQAGVDWIWEVPAVVVLGLGGIAVAGCGVSRRFQGQLLPLARIGAVALALGLAATQVPSLVSLERLRASASELRAGDLHGAAKSADQAVRAAPWAASPYVQRALVARAQGRMAIARRDLKRAVERERTNWRHQLLLAELAATTGDAGAMAATLAMARRLAPNFAWIEQDSPFVERLELQLERASGRGDARPYGG